MNALRILLVLVVGGAPFVALGCKKTKTKQEMLSGMSEQDRRALESMTNTPFLVDAANTPEFISASESRLNDNQEVIGVIVDGEARAYPLSRLSAMVDHVVNDSHVDETGQTVEFSVTYCDMTDCIRVLELAPDATEATLDIGTLGLLDGGLALRWNDKQFKQMDKVEGLKDMPFQRKNWAEWKSEYPETIVYVGRVKPSR